MALGDAAAAAAAAGIMRRHYSGIGVTFEGKMQGVEEAGAAGGTVFEL